MRHSGPPDPTRRDLKPPPLTPDGPPPVQARRRGNPALVVQCSCGCRVYVNVSRVSGSHSGMAAYWTADTDWCPACRRRLRIAVEMDNWTLTGTPNIAALTLVERETMPEPRGAIERRRPR